MRSSAEPDQIERSARSKSESSNRTPTSTSQSIITEMLQRLNNKTVRGPTFIVSVPDIHRVQYAEGKKVACVEIEGGFSPDNKVNWLIYSETLRGWERPHDDVEMSKAKREAILANISKSLDVLAMPHQVV